MLSTWRLSLGRQKVGYLSRSMNFSGLFGFKISGNVLVFLLDLNYRVPSELIVSLNSRRLIACSF
jgi:hypothetical protein